jgi:tRNA dimethylallyltransferase
MDIGTAKPAAHIRERLPHHLIDVVDPDTQFNAGLFVRHADKLVRRISRDGGIPVISGGTAFYLRNFAFGLPESPPGSSEYRDLLYEEAAEKGWAALYKELTEKDPDYARKIGPNDTGRIARALEVVRSSGRPLSSFDTSSGLRDWFDLLLIGLERPRSELYARIDQRVEQMFSRGLETEVRDLMTRGYTDQDPGLQAIGYREFFQAVREDLSKTEVLALVQRNTRRYAKRQMTFFRSLPGVHWYHPDAGREIGQLIDGFLGF